MSYQAVIRNSSNTLVTSSTVGVQVSILQSSISGIEVYKEIYSPNPQTNANGLVTIEIGSGIALSGSFASINWANGPYFIKTEIDPLGGTDYTITGISEILSVPYALFAKTAENISGGITEVDPVFTNHVSNGITSTNITNWNSAYNWGNHAGLYSITGHSHPYLPLIGGEMSNANVVTNLNADLLDGQNGSFYAPSSVYPATGLTSGYLPYMRSTMLANSPVRTDGANMGIGISPIAKLDVSGSSEYAVDAAMIARFKGSGNYGLGISVTGKNTWLQSGYLGHYNYDVTNILLNPMGGSIFIGYTSDPTNNNKLAVNGTGYFKGTIDATSYKLSGISTFLDWTRTGYTGTPGQVLTSQGASITPIWSTLGTAAVSSIGDFIQNQDTIDQNANVRISGNISALKVNIPNTTSSNSGIINFGGTPFIHNYHEIGVEGENIFIGYNSGNFTMGAKGGASYLSSKNTALGNNSLRINTTGSRNTAIGSDALFSNTTGYHNAAIGQGAMLHNTSGHYNTAVGMDALWDNTTGYYNVAVGRDALCHVTTGYQNIGIGVGSGFHLGAGIENVIVGDFAMYENIDGDKNTAMGKSSMRNNISGSNNTTIGNFALASNKSGSGNVVLGSEAGYYETGSNKLFIDNHHRGNEALGRSSSLIYGIFDTNISNQYIRINGKIGSGISPVAKLDIAGISEYAVDASMIARFKGSGNYGLGISVTGKNTWLQSGYLGHYNYDVTNILLNPMGGSIFMGYTSDPTYNNKLAVNGNIFANGVITATGGSSTNWNAAYIWGNHAGLYRQISYVPAWSEITSNPFSFSSVSNNQLLKYNSTTLKWENWTPNFLTSYTESDPNFAAWNKTSGIIITASQVSDFNTSVSNNTAVVENSTKNSYPLADAAKLAGVESGAEVNVNADWNATNGDAQILNKPEIPAGTNPGDMQYWDGTQWVMIAAGQPGQFLQFTASNKPVWTTIMPIITTVGVSDITSNSATCTGNVISNGGGTIIELGVCWSASPNPTTANNKTTDGTGGGIFTSLITGLTNSTTYYARAYVTYSSYTAYGNELSFISGQ
jgi:hypothetical protein